MIPFPQDKKYNIIYADPAWNLKLIPIKEKRKVQKIIMIVWIVKDIKNLPVKNIADENSILFIWVIYPILEQAFKVIQNWGFKYSTCAFSWIKKNKKVR